MKTCRIEVIKTITQHKNTNKVNIKCSRKNKNKRGSGHH